MDTLRHQGLVEERGGGDPRSRLHMLHERCPIKYWAAHPEAYTVYRAGNGCSPPISRSSGQNTRADVQQTISGGKSLRRTYVSFT